MVKRRYITFIEMMIVLTIMILTLGLIGVNIRSLVNEQRFRSEVSLVVDQLRLAQDLMLILRTDAIVKFRKEKEGGIKSWIEVENNLSKAWQKEISRDQPLYAAIHSIEFEDSASGGKIQDRFDLNFLSGGSIMSQGILHLYNQDHSLESFICLPGYPRPIFNVAQKEMDPGCNPRKETDFAEKLTFSTQREITDKELKQ